jgi:hypothetical protein
MLPYLTYMTYLTHLTSLGEQTYMKFDYLKKAIRFVTLRCNLP